ncbi:DUF3536 domain-containing protein [Tuwongella immobilis]|uniref:Glycoside hydrolase family 57 N-terminal domain-containing protein n=1 Tax=Tuwongella immobilis TaxID=692036 RepID=A0A6C2YT62_9BACT|nr:DUF3536 domain-containing protein [Tuwongella immobilis]VIP04072.1 glycoside hydrolase : Glycoside hydrolase family 57 OS=Chloroflexus aggregans (strain MD-66 / DSM 9485) GN=Cagg_2093 PE=3 SV=1: Glyco_hydro_57: DUF3536 [Tuwongella immobilis]VTS05511.1 glycoside hydrolase : Glycoside hydrolase family 57 OS=Chloroflexus aggregans (strain MD-66 / DSM 9485) GN=Cagg_2093 PE=3 SV=1: Glyco_hydro_57: DUF3536 [Tuwongella immobilis]
MTRFICIHGHFYQPPRENPWLDEIELQDSAHPFHDWNERISTECYAPNAVARILNPAGKIVQLSNNYSKISFNFGPTLLSWMEQHAPDVYAAILEADRLSIERFGGHGSAMAQVYNHMIMPLANRRDKITQIVWGIRDFEHRFGRMPEGMWLAETAVDLETLDLLAEHGIRFTVLSPYQAHCIRPLAGVAPLAGPSAEDPDRTTGALPIDLMWREVTGARIDPKEPYLQRLPSGRTIAIFFYDAPVSQAVAFERLLAKGEYLVQRLMGAFLPDRAAPQLVHIATDGESYGHHSAHGDMALAYALHSIETQGVAQLTNYGQYLEMFPPTMEVDILERTAWSCAHGVDRWRADCGCNSGRPVWRQQWRGPLRAALDGLRDHVGAAFEREAGKILRDPWAARDDAISLRLLGTPEERAAFVQRHARSGWTSHDRVRVMQWMELQRNALLMYTSCGWFFDDISGIETVQILMYAGRVLQLARELGVADYEPTFLQQLELAPSNVPEHRNGRVVYEKFVATAPLTWEKIAAHYAISSLFEEYGPVTQLFGYLAEIADYESLEVGKVRLVLGRVRLTEETTAECAQLMFGVLYFGDHNLNCGVKLDPGDAAYQRIRQQLGECWSRLDYPQIIRLMDREFGQAAYSLASLFRDEQRHVLRRLLKANLAETEATYARIVHEHQPLMRFLQQLNAPLPRAFMLAAEHWLHSNLRQAMDHESPDFDTIQALIRDAVQWGIHLEQAELAYRFGKLLARVAEHWHADPTAVDRMQLLGRGVSLARSLPFVVDLWKVQNLVFRKIQSLFPRIALQAAGHRESAQQWVQEFTQLAERLNLDIEFAREIGGIAR